MMAAEFLEELVAKMDAHGQAERGMSFRIDAVHPDASVDVVVGDLDDDARESRFVMAYAGEFDSGSGIHQMVEIREEVPIVMNAVAKFVVAAALEI